MSQIQCHSHVRQKKAQICSHLVSGGIDFAPNSNVWGPVEGQQCEMVDHKFKWRLQIDPGIRSQGPIDSNSAHVPTLSLCQPMKGSQRGPEDNALKPLNQAIPQHVWPDDWGLQLSGSHSAFQYLHQPRTTTFEANHMGCPRSRSFERSCLRYTSVFLGYRCRALSA